MYYDAAGFCDRLRHSIGLAGFEEHPRRVEAALWEINVSPRAAFRLVIAGRVLRLRGHRIACAPGEAYPLAVLRVLLVLPADTREVLRAEVDFLESLGPDGAPSATIRERWAERLAEPLQTGNGQSPGC